MKVLITIILFFIVAGFTAPLLTQSEKTWITTTIKAATDPIWAQINWIKSGKTSDSTRINSLVNASSSQQNQINNLLNVATTQSGEISALKTLTTTQSGEINALKILTTSQSDEIRKLQDSIRFIPLMRVDTTVIVGKTYLQFRNNLLKIVQ